MKTKVENTSKKQGPPVITIIGAGSQVFGFNMCTDICQTPVLKGAEVRLVDIDSEKLAVMKKLFEIVSEMTGTGLQVSTFTNRREALPDSEYVIISVAYERIQRWDKDLSISRRHGIVETQGECGGPGGLSLTLRNIPLMLEIAKDVEELAPGAMILNFTNPMMRVCLAVTRYTNVPCVGLCHGLIEAQNMLSTLLSQPLKAKGCGINHFNWIYGAVRLDNGEDLWPQVKQAFSKSDLQNHSYIRDLFGVFGRIVSPDDGHITDFIHHWRGEHDGLNSRYGLHAKEMDSYRKEAKQWDDRMSDYINGRKEPMVDVNGLSGEGTIPIIAAFSGLAPAYNEISVNIPNAGYITNLPNDAVVELPARISTGKIQGEEIGDLPKGIRSLICRQLDIAQLAVEAAVEGSYSKALQALAIDPIVTDLQVARSYLKDILDAHKDILSRFA